MRKLLGRLQGMAANRRLSIAADLDDNLARADAMAASFKRAVDVFIDDMGWMWQLTPHRRNSIQPVLLLNLSSSSSSGPN